MSRVSAFLSRYWEDGDSEREVRAELRRVAASGERIRLELEADVAALRTVLDDPARDWCLPYLVETYANVGLESFTSATARDFLRRFAASADDALDAPTA